MPNAQVTQAQIAEAAFYIWLDEGQPECREQEHWLRAEQALTTPAKPKRRAAAKPRAKTAAASKPAAKPRKAKTKTAS